MQNELGFLTVRETARYLKITPNTVMIWCRTGRLPAVKMGRQWRILKNEIDRWALEAALHNTPEAAAATPTPAAR